MARSKNIVLLIVVFSHSEIIHLSLCWGCFGLRFSAIFLSFFSWFCKSLFFPFQSGLPIFRPGEAACFSDSVISLCRFLSISSMLRFSVKVISSSSLESVTSGNSISPSFCNRLVVMSLTPSTAFCSENWWNTCGFKIGRDNTDLPAWRFLNLDTA
nr:hypothetical protein [Escherichia coli]